MPARTSKNEPNPGGYDRDRARKCTKLPTFRGHEQCVQTRSGGFLLVVLAIATVCN